MFAIPAAENALKRKRSPSATTNILSAPPPKLSKPTTTTASTPTPTPTTTTSNGSNVSSTNQLQINYLARQCAVDLPFINKDDTLPGILEVLGSYSQVLDRHESLASNLGARPLGPNLIKRFERCFDAPPEIIASHSHAKNPQAADDSSPAVSWLDVVHFAQAHPAQFTLSTFSEGRRVCQFYYPQKQVRVQISEEDFLFISSGRCQDLIPPLPIWEDEEKEVGTCEILEKTLRELTNAADLVAARTRQLGHRLKGRRMAILERRAAETGANGVADQDQHAKTPPATARTAGFVAVNATTQPHPQPLKNTALDKPDAGATIRTDLLKHFQSLPHNQSVLRHETRRISAVQPTSPIQPASQQTTKHSTPTPATAATAPLPEQQLQQQQQQQQQQQHATSSSSVSPVLTATYPPDALSYYLSDGPARTTTLTPTSNDNASKHNFSRPLPPNLESVQPYRHICQQHMELLPRGSRVLPPCDRCRRLRMDCVKNLSSCAGCTKKHSRCHWKDVGLDEARELEGFDDVGATEAHTNGGVAHDLHDNGRQSMGMGDTVTPPPSNFSAEGAEVVSEHEHPHPDHQQHHQQAMDNLRGVSNSDSNSNSNNPDTVVTATATTPTTNGNLTRTTEQISGTAAAAAAAVASSIRNNGAFRSVYTSVYPPMSGPPPPLDQHPASSSGTETPTGAAALSRSVFEKAAVDVGSIKAGGEEN